MNPELDDLLARLRGVPMGAPSDVTRTPRGGPPRQPTIGPAETPLERERRNPQGRRGVVASVARAATESSPTLLGMLNEMANPMRAGAQAREFVEDAVRSAGAGRVEGALGSAALLATTLPGLPGPDDAARVASKMIDVDGVMRPMLNSRGQLIHPTEEGIRNFWRWATEEGRQPITDDFGRPRTLYHGTAGEVKQYDLSQNRPELTDRFQGEGINASESPDVASLYAEAARNALPRRRAVLEAAESVMPPSVSRLFQDIIDNGYDKAWNVSDEQIAELMQTASDAGIDLNDVGDVARVVDGSRYAAGRDWDVGDTFAGIFGGSGGPSFGDYDYDAMRRLGIESAAPKPNVIPLYMRARNVLETGDRAIARNARESGFDALRFTGEDLVGGVPETVAFDPLDIKSAIGNSGAFSRTNPRLTAGLLAALGLESAANRGQPRELRR